MKQNDELTHLAGLAANSSNVIDFDPDGASLLCDAVVIGAGLTGMSSIYKLRKHGLTVKCFEAGSDFGGVWHWNRSAARGVVLESLDWCLSRYPGAKTDSEVPFYQLDIPEVWKTWNYSQRFPDQHELRQYIAHVDKVLDLRQDTTFGARVNSCVWNEKEAGWTIRTEQGHVARCNYLIVATGVIHLGYTPDFPGLQDYKGEIFHSSKWDEKFDPSGKRVGIIGAGATGVQITQYMGKHAREVDVFIRRPNYCLPMRQRPLSEIEQIQAKSFYPALFKEGKNSVAGFPVERPKFGVFDVNSEQREAHWERTWDAGGFQFLLSTYADVGTDPAANRVMYDFWAKHVKQRLPDPAKQKIMVPDKPPYHFATRITPLEEDYYDVLNQENVRIHDLNSAPLATFTANSIKTSDGVVHELDAVALATGFDTSTGTMVRLGLRSKNSEDIKEVWKDGVRTYLGLMAPGFPNMFFPYRPHSPASHSNATTTIEIQTDLVIEIIQHLEKEHACAIEPTDEAADEWKAGLAEVVNKTLRRYTDSWWNNSNIPGKKVEIVTYMKGVEAYNTECRAAIGEMNGFVLRGNR